jgi:hypothetical protein
MDELGACAAPWLGLSLCPGDAETGNKTVGKLGRYPTRAFGRPMVGGARRSRSGARRSRRLGLVCQERPPVVGGEPGGVGGVAEVGDDGGEAVGVVVVGHVAGAGEDL